MPRNSPVQKYLVCNSDESEPGTCHDRDILRYNPHCAHRGPGHRRLCDECHRRLQLYPRRVSGRARAALRGSARRGLRGGAPRQEHQGSGIDFDIYTFIGAGAYICGEETALLDSLEGKPGKPRFKPPFPANFGLYGAPTTINNTQSFASVPTILRKGRGWFASFGPANSGGTVIFSVSGHVEKPGNFEVPLGIPFKDLLRLPAACGGAASSRP